MLEIRNLHVQRRGKTICQVPGMTVDCGERVALVGANGSGKTTLLRVLSGLEHAFQGEVAVSVTVRERVYLHQLPYLFRGTVLANVMLGAAARKLLRQQRMAEAREWLDRLGVAHLADRQSAGLSGGERRRVALARTFITGARLLLLDEPFADLDQAGIDGVCRAMDALPEATFVVSSPGDVPRQLAEARVSWLDPPS
ncbi:MAG: ATP-binding cassette domain-containing protein [Planctomycetota bacterium]|nr:ATP-binding cassette domain-containing protein [Planctomycetota bacterium]